MKYPFLFITFIAVCSFLTGCADDDFTTDPSHRLSFSSDTLRFDTVFTTLSSATAKLMVYNHNGKTLNINSITLRNSGTSGFRVNVDGMKGSRFEQVEISKKDSLYIFVEVTVDPVNQDEPTRQEDVLEFEYNGVLQKVTLEAYGQDAIFWKGKIISADTLLSAGKPILVYDSLVIQPDARLKMDAGTRLFFHDKARVIVSGSIEANGEQGNPVVFRGNRLDKLFPNLPYDGLAGQWGGIRFREESYDNYMRHTEIRGTTHGIRFDSAAVDRTKAKFEFCKIRNSSTHLIYAESSVIEASDCELVNAGGAILYLAGGDNRFTHCTIANLFSFGVISDMAVHLSNYKYDEEGEVTGLPLLRADFNNCIIWGKRQAEINLDAAKEEQHPGLLFNHFFDYCVLRAKGEDDENFEMTVWDGDPLFLATGDDYRYDFRIDSLSAARGKGNPTHALSCPVDLAGNPRTGVPDIGAYQWQSQ